jgi:hypothetical protein
VVENQTCAVNQTSKVENYLVPNPKLFPTNTFKSVLVGNLFETNFYSKYDIDEASRLKHELSDLDFPS